KSTTATGIPNRKNAFSSKGQREVTIILFSLNSNNKPIFYTFEAFHPTKQLTESDDYPKIQIFLAAHP
ncbi:hypothetical protein LN386_25475, partial [Enterobacter hormaechei subsp. steigerwaltii]|nr:hypothetical protein [Enterobacter hormaechei subsp. steigerwaltii]